MGLSKFKNLQGNFASKKKESAGEMVPADASFGLSQEEVKKLEEAAEEPRWKRRRTEDWDIYDLWDFILDTYDGKLSESLSRSGDGHTKNLSRLVNKIGDWKYIREVAEFYAKHWDKLRDHYEWTATTNPSQFAYCFDDVAFCMKYGFKKHGHADRIGDKTDEDYKNAKW